MDELLETLDNDDLAKDFHTFLVAEFSSEHILFFQDVQKFVTSPSKYDALKIYDTYVSHDAALCINVSSEARYGTKELIESDEITIDLFDRLEREVLLLMLNDPFPRFKRTHAYKKRIDAEVEFM